MDKLDTNQSFGIENTVDTSGAGNQQLLDNLFETDTTTASPEDVTPTTTTSSTEDGKGPDGKADPANLAAKDDTDIPANIAENPDKLTNFLLGEEEEESEKKTSDVSDDNVDKKKSEENKEENTNDASDAIDNANGNNNSDEGTIAFDTLANELADLGVFTRLEGEEDGVSVKSPEDFLERFKKEKQQGAQEIISDFLGQFGQDYQEAFQAIYVNGVNPKEYFTQSAKIEDFSNLDLTNESNQERVVRETLQDQGFETEDIDKEIEKLKNYGDLEDVSKRHHKVLVKKETAQLARKAEEAKLQNQVKLEQKTKYVENVRNVLQEKIKAKDFDGIPVNSKVANELQDFLLVDKWKTQSGETLTDFDKSILDLKRPENHEQKVKVALLLKLLEKDPTLSTIKKRGVSERSSQLFKDVARQKTSNQRSEDNKKQPARSWFE